MKEGGGQGREWQETRDRSTAQRNRRTRAVRQRRLRVWNLDAVIVGPDKVGVLLGHKPGGEVGLGVGSRVQRAAGLLGRASGMLPHARAHMYPAGPVEVLQKTDERRPLV